MAMKILGYSTAKFGSQTIQKSNFFEKLPGYYLSVFLAYLFSIAVTIHTIINLVINLRNLGWNIAV